MYLKWTEIQLRYGLQPHKSPKSRNLFERNFMTFLRSKEILSFEFLLGTHILLHFNYHEQVVYNAVLYVPMFQSLPKFKQDLGKSQSVQ